MKSMKLWMAVAVAVALGTGCGGGMSAEDACNEVEDGLNKVEDRMESCLGGEEIFGPFDTEACVEGASECSDDDRENAVAQMNCALDLFTCENFEDDAKFEEMMEKLEKCEDDHPVSASCEGVDVGVQSASRKAMKLRSGLSK